MSNRSEYFFNTAKTAIVRRIDEASVFIENGIIEINTDTDFIRIAHNPEMYIVSGNHNEEEFSVEITRGCHVREEFAIECLIFEARRIWKETH